MSLQSDIVAFINPDIVAFNIRSTLPRSLLYWTIGLAT